MRWEKIIFHEKLKRVSGYTVLSGKGGSAPITDHRQVCLPFNITDFGEKSVKAHRIGEREEGEREGCMVGSMPSQPITHFYFFFK
ncbi:hypothetical protein HanRHA438_Chr03g0135571 [Helianthus annuus]|nr:hypothetical protein HanRHA438_Chr03g0135571 [Helianthus annuus]